MEQPLVSIVVNCYNSARYLRATIDSILAQTFVDYEVVFWDNQSTDDTADIIRSYADPRFRYHYASDHLSLGAARNRAMEKAVGRYLTFLDSDDVWLPDFLARAVSCLRVENCSLYYSNFYNWIEGRLRRPNNDEKESGRRSFGELLGSYRVGMSAAVFDLADANRHGIRFDARYQLVEDYDFFLKIVRYGEAWYDAKPLMLYRMHAASLTNRSGKNWSVEFELLRKSLITTLGAEGRRYVAQLKWLKVRAVNASAEELIRDGRRLQLLRLIVLNCHLSVRLLFPLIYLVSSKTCYYKIRAFLRTTSYRV